MAFQEPKKTSEDKVSLSATDARQGVRGTHLFAILVAALALAAIVWGGVEVWGRYIEPNKYHNAAPTISSSSGQPQAGTVDNTPPPPGNRSSRRRPIARKTINRERRVRRPSRVAMERRTDAVASHAALTRSAA